MKITYKYRKNFLGIKRDIEIFDFAGQEKELALLLEGLEVVQKHGR